LEDCLKAISQLSYPKNQFEVIVVDDSDDRGITQFVSPFYDQFNLIVLSQRNAGPAAARNKGGRHARGRYLVFTDDDCIPSTDWLDALAQRLLKTPECAIAGKTVNALTSNPYSTASQIIIDYLYAHYNMNTDHAKYAVSSNLALPAEGFDVIGGFNTDFTRPGGEDRDLCARWLDQGLRIVYAPEVIVHHYHDLSLKSFLNQHLNYGRGAYFYHQKRSELIPDSERMESLRFYINLISYPLTQLMLRKRLWLVILLALSQVSILAGYLLEKIKRNKEYRS
jgi:GT2 family glycosyltransferase